MLGYNYTHVLYDQYDKIVGWIIDNKRVIDEPFRELPALLTAQDFAYPSAWATGLFPKS